MRWTICSAVWRAMGRPQLGQCGRAHRGVEQAQVVVDLGDGADGGTRAAAGGLLLDGDGRAEAFDGVHVGPFDLVEKLARVGRKRFDVAPLALGIDGVEGERALAGAGETGDDGQRVAWDAHIDVAQIVLARPAHRDVSNGHGEELGNGGTITLVCGRSPQFTTLRVFYWSIELRVNADPILLRQSHQCCSFVLFADTLG